MSKRKNKCCCEKDTMNVAAMSQDQMLQMVY